MTNKNELMEKIISLAKRRGFMYQSSEIYGGLAGFWDYGPLGVELKENIKNTWLRRFVYNREDMYRFDAAIIMNPKTWEASGHVGGFSDPLVECKKCHARFRADQLNDPKKCPDCGGTLGEVRQFNMMFKTHVGAIDDSSSLAYLRPETAQGMFVNFKNIIDSFHPVLPFGLAQIGKAYRNEIAPRDFLFRSREFEQMEIEYFIKPPKDAKDVQWQEIFDHFKKEMLAFIGDLGLDGQKIHELEVPDGERAHYSKRTVDFEYDFPFGKKELYGLAYRTDFDLKQHANFAKSDLSYYDEETKERYVPHVIEPSFGLDRSVLAVLANAYTEDELGGEKRVYLKFPAKIAPTKIAVFPLLKNKPQLIEKAKQIYAMLKKEFGAVEFDDNGNIGKRYRRQDEVGTPFCITVDFETLEKNSGVTVRDRDSGKQERVGESDLISYLKTKFN